MTMSASKSSDGRPTRNHVALDLIRRFHPSGDAGGNAALACDPSGLAAVSEEALESVDYERPSFNWPPESSPEGNFFVIDAMASDILRTRGFTREARSLKARIHFNTPRYTELPTLLHHYLDFAPARSLPDEDVAELTQMAEKMGLDVEAVLKARKKTVSNPLAHKGGTPKQEWDWLVQNAGVTSPFGKTAACELSGEAIAFLSTRWLGELGSPPALPASDPSFANRAWFDNAFPLGWIKVDHLHEAAIISAPMDFASRVTLIAYEIASKARIGMDAADVARFGFNHLNTVGINGAALLGQEGAGYFHQFAAPQLLKGASAPSKSGATGGPLAQFLGQASPSIAALPAECAVWLAYRVIDPHAAHAIEKLWLAGNAKAKASPDEPGLSAHQRGALSAGLERLSLLESDARQAMECPPSAPRSPSAPAQAPAPRL